MPTLVRNKFSEYRMHHENTWMCEDGRVLKVSEMSNGHIINSISMLERHDHQDYLVYIGLTTEIKRRKENNVVIQDKNPPTTRYT